MSPLLVVAIIVVGIGLTVRSARRGFGDRHALDAHHRALDTLAEIAARRDSEASQVSGDEPAPVQRPTRPRERRLAAPAPVPRRQPDWAPANHSDPAWQGTTADEARPPLVPPARAASMVAQTRASSGVVRRYPPAHRKRAFPFAAVAIGGAAIVAVVLAVGLTMLLGHHSRSPAQRPAATARSPVTTPSTTSSPAPVTLVSSDSQEARFRVAPTGANIALVPNSPCWVQIRTGAATGPVVFAGTLHHGDRRPLPAGQTVWLRMGNPPGMSIEVNGAPLPITAPASSQPFNVIFEPVS